MTTFAYSYRCQLCRDNVEHSPADHWRLALSTDQPPMTPQQAYEMLRSARNYMMTFHALSNQYMQIAMDALMEGGGLILNEDANVSNMERWLYIRDLQEAACKTR